jgi:hypothetical protein
MKMLVVYDKKGNIVSVSLPDNTIVGSTNLIPGKWSFVAEIDTSQVGHACEVSANQDDIPKHVKNMVNDFRIQQGKLVPKK